MPHPATLLLLSLLAPCLPASGTSILDHRKLRIVFTHIGKGRTRSELTEFEIWDK